MRPHLPKIWSCSPTFFLITNLPMVWSAVAIACSAQARVEHAPIAGPCTGAMSPRMHPDSSAATLTDWSPHGRGTSR